MLNNKNKHKLTPKQEKFINFYIETGNAAESARRAGYSSKTADNIGQENLRKPMIREEILARTKSSREKQIATAEDVMTFFTKAMNGEIKDQFGLEATLSDRIRAGQELAKRTVDIENKMAGKEDSTVHIKLDWD